MPFSQARVKSQVHLEIALLSGFPNLRVPVSRLWVSTCELWLAEIDAALTACPTILCIDSTFFLLMSWGLSTASNRYWTLLCQNFMQISSASSN